MRNEVFVDAGAWFAIVSADDALHTAAVEQYRRLLIESRPLVTTNLVVAEAHVLIRRSVGHALAIRFLQSLRMAARLRRIYSHAALEEAAERILARYSDHDFSFTDAVSCAVMQEREITEAFAFDRQFLIAGFTTLPAR